MTVANNPSLDVAVGISRKTKTWKNKKMEWSELLDRLSKTTRTQETVAEYRAMSKSQQSDIKDVGGFVGGYLNNGSRTDVRFRSVLCLDADFGDSQIWTDWQTFYGYAAAIYSTHKHTPEKPRLRLVVPLARNVTPEEYQAIGRRIAHTLGIDKFDDTSYQPQRMMYWPSTSYDGEYVFDYEDAETLNPDIILQTYVDWHDISAWPVSSRVANITQHASTKPQDPTEKKSVVGAFCRAYSIEDAIENFIPTYQPCDDGRYTYTEGSTAAGVITYDGKWSFSHHATDPASETLCNAWDLVRLHKFGRLDDGIDIDTPVNKRPSYTEMTKFATADKKVSAQLVKDRNAEAMDDFDDDLVNDWRAKIQVTGKGGIAQTIRNAVLILENDEELEGCLAFNEMDHNIVLRKSPPWRGLDERTQWVDADDAELRYFLESKYGLTGKDRIFDAVNVVAQQNRFHPVRDYLNSFTWDGTNRLDTLLIDYLGAEDTDYTRAVTRKTLVAAVARVFRPGCKFDYMLTIRGRQGLGKSTLISKLGGQWFSDTFTTMQGKDAYEQVQGVWLMEVGELAGMRKAEAETIKLYISKQVDRFRPAYGRRLQEFPRQCIFFGTTNEMQFLRDTTGNRRFWVVDTPNEPTHSPWEDLTETTIGQIWAEAVEFYKKGEPLFLSKELEEEAKEVQARFEEENPRIGIVAEYLDKLLPENWDSMDAYERRNWLEAGQEGTEPRRYVCALEIWTEALNGNPDKVDRYAVKEIHDIMTRIPEWRHQGNSQKTFPIYGKQKFYERLR